MVPSHWPSLLYHIFFGGGGFFDCDPKSKTIENPKSHFWEVLSPKMVKIQSAVFSGRGSSWIVILSPKLLKSPTPTCLGGGGGVGLIPSGNYKYNKIDLEINQEIPRNYNLHFGKLAIKFDFLSGSTWFMIPLFKMQSNPVVFVISTEAELRKTKPSQTIT